MLLKLHTDTFVMMANHPGARLAQLDNLSNGGARRGFQQGALQRDIHQLADRLKAIAHGETVDLDRSGGTAVAAQFLARFSGGAPVQTVDAMLAGLGWPADQPLANPATPDFAKRTARLAAMAAMTPAFQSV